MIKNRKAITFCSFFIFSVLLIVSCSVKLEKGNSYAIKDELSVISSDGRTLVLGKGDVVEYLGMEEEKAQFKIVIAKGKSDANQKIDQLGQQYNQLMGTSLDFDVATKTGDKFSLNSKQANKFLKIDYDYSFYRAAGKGDLDTAKNLISKGADLHIKRNGYSAIYIACMNGHLEVVKFLLEKGANINPLESMPLQIALGEGHSEIAKLLISKGANINSYDFPYGTPLGMAATNGNLEMVNFLLEKGALVNPPKGNPLNKAINNGHTDVAKILIDNGADISKGDPFKSAVRNGNVELAYYLLEKGATLKPEDELAIATELSDIDWIN